MIDIGLESGLQQPPASGLARDTITQQLWGRYQSGQNLNQSEVNLDKYWVYYNKECTRALHDCGRHIAARSHLDIVETAQKIKKGMSREDVKYCLREQLAATCHPHIDEDELLDHSINLTASLMLMMDFGSSPYAFSGRSQLNWSSGSLQDFVHGYFSVDHPAPAQESMRLEKLFIARNLDKIAGLEFVWTDNLADHLRLTDDDTRVHIFHHAAFLKRQQKCDDGLLPEGLAEETLRTLALLFPSSNRDTKKWIAKLSSRHDLDERLGHCGRLKTDDRHIDKFRFWRERLVILKQIFDESQPSNMSQWWHDRRNGVQWYTFWVAVLVLILTVIFGIVQCVEGGLQAYASFLALRVPGGDGSGAAGPGPGPI